MFHEWHHKMLKYWQLYIEYTGQLLCSLESIYFLTGQKALTLFGAFCYSTALMANLWEELNHYWIMRIDDLPSFKEVSHSLISTKSCCHVSAFF